MKYNAIAIPFNFKTKDDWSDYEELCNSISDKGDVSVLVNAVEQFDLGKGKIHKTSD